MVRWVIGTGPVNDKGRSALERREVAPAAQEETVDSTPDPVDAGKPIRAAIVNADDFGRTEGVNEGVIRAYEEGIVTSASLMVRWADSDEAARYSRRQAVLGLGLHLDLGEWVLTPRGWEAVYEVVPTDDADAVRAELANQLGRFHKLMDRSPTHIDSHQHVHMAEPVRTVVVDFARRLGIPVRQASKGIDYCGGFHGQGGDGSPYPEGISAANVVALFDAMAPGVTELSCHPGVGDDFASPYSTEREAELAVLCDPTVRRAIEEREIALISFRSLRRSGADAFEHATNKPAA